MKAPVLSILIASLVSRTEMFRKLTKQLARQITDATKVEVLVLTDSKEKTTGYKRQKLLTLAKGEYVVFIDDDDWVPAYYVSEMLKACESGADCIAINGIMTTDGGKPVPWKLSKDYENEDVPMPGVGMMYLRRTNHITAVKRKLALKAGFPDISNAEDKYYSDRLNKHLKTEFTISKPMYEYRFSTQNKEYK